MLKIIGAVILAFVLLMSAFGCWVWWDIHRLRSFCQEIQPGLPITALAALARKHGIDEHWVASEGAFDEREKIWFIFVPALSTMGDVNCTIHHDKVHVLLAHVVELP